MHFTAILKQGPVYKKWMLLNTQGGTLHGTNFTRVGHMRQTVFVADEIDDLDALKNDPNIMIEMTSVDTNHAQDDPPPVTIEAGPEALAIAAELESVFITYDETDEDSKPRKRGRPRKVE